MVSISFQFLFIARTCDTSRTCDTRGAQRHTNTSSDYAWTNTTDCCTESRCNARPVSWVDVDSYERNSTVGQWITYVSAIQSVSYCTTVAYSSFLRSFSEESLYRQWSSCSRESRHYYISHDSWFSITIIPHYT